MIVLDTNVLSELMKATPDEIVVRWVAGQPASALYTTSISEAEVFHGIMLLAPGKRRDAFEAAAGAMFEEDFDGRILPFESAAAHSYARIAAQRRRSGRPISHFDAQIAAIADSTSASIATRNVKDFHGCGAKVIDPWQT